MDGDRHKSNSDTTIGRVVETESTQVVHADRGVQTEVMEVVMHPEYAQIHGLEPVIRGDPQALEYVDHLHSKVIEMRGVFRQISEYVPRL